MFVSVTVAAVSSSIKTRYMASESLRPEPILPLMHVLGLAKQCIQEIFLRRSVPVSEKSLDALHRVTVLSNMPSSSAILRCFASPKVTFS